MVFFIFYLSSERNWMTPLPPGAGFMWSRTFVWVYNWSIWPCFYAMLISLERLVYVLCSSCIRLREAGTGRKGRIVLACLMVTYSAVTMSPKGLTASGKGQPCPEEACACCHKSQWPQSLSHRKHLGRRACTPLWAVFVSTVAVSHGIGLFHRTVSKGQMLESEFHTTVKAMAAEAGWKWRSVLPKEHRMSRSISKPNEKGRNEESVSALTSRLLGIRHLDFIFTSLSGCSLARRVPFLMLIPSWARARGYRRLSAVHLLKSRSLNRAEAWAPFKV